MAVVIFRKSGAKAFQLISTDVQTRRQRMPAEAGQVLGAGGERVVKVKAAVAAAGTFSLVSVEAASASSMAACIKAFSARIGPGCRFLSFLSLPLTAFDAIIQRRPANIERNVSDPLPFPVCFLYLKLLSRAVRMLES